MFKMLCHFYRVFPKYLETLFQFDVETCKTEEYFSPGCHRDVQNDDGGRSTIFGTLQVKAVGNRSEEHTSELQSPA